LLRFTYRSSAARMTSETVSSRCSALSLAASQSSSGTRMVRCGVRLCSATRSPRVNEAARGALDGELVRVDPVERDGQPALAAGASVLGRDDTERQVPLGTDAFVGGRELAVDDDRLAGLRMGADRDVHAYSVHTHVHTRKTFREGDKCTNPIVSQKPHARRQTPRRTSRESGTAPMTQPQLNAPAAPAPSAPNASNGRSRTKKQKASGVACPPANAAA